MVIPIDIGTLLERNAIEFKENWNPMPITRTICAFANDIDNTWSDYIVIDVNEEDGEPKIPPSELEYEFKFIS